MLDLLTVLLVPIADWGLSSEEDDDEVDEWAVEGAESEGLYTPISLLLFTELEPLYSERDDAVLVRGREDVVDEEEVVGDLKGKRVITMSPTDIKSLSLSLSLSLAIHLSIYVGLSIYIHV